MPKVRIEQYDTVVSFPDSMPQGDIERHIVDTILPDLEQRYGDRKPTVSLPAVPSPPAVERSPSLIPQFATGVVSTPPEPELPPMTGRELEFVGKPGSPEAEARAEQLARERGVIRIPPEKSLAEPPFSLSHVKAGGVPLDAVALVAPNLVPLMKTELGGEVSAGLYNAVADLTEFFMSPLGTATVLSGSGGARALAGIGQKAGAKLSQAVSFGFAGDMARHFPEQFRETVKAIRSGDIAKAVEHVTVFAATPFFITKSLQHGIAAGRQVRMAEAIERTDAAGAKLTAAVLEIELRRKAAEDLAAGRTEQVIPKAAEAAKEPKVVVESAAKPEVEPKREERRLTPEEEKPPVAILKQAERTHTKEDLKKVAEEMNKDLRELGAEEITPQQFEDLYITAVQSNVVGHPRMEIISEYEMRRRMRVRQLQKEKETDAVSERRTVRVPKEAQAPNVPTVAREVRRKPEGEKAARVVEPAKVEKPIAPKKGSKRFVTSKRRFDNETERSGEDILSWMADESPMMSKTQARKIGRYEKLKAEYDDLPPLAAPHHNVVYRGQQAPDQVAQAAYEAGKIPEPTTRALSEAMVAASKARLESVKARKAELELLEEQAKQAEEFEKATESGKEAINTEDLKTGDTLEIEGEKVTVEDIDPDTFDVTLDDGRRFGEQTLKSGSKIWVEDYKPSKQEGFEPGLEPEPAPTPKAKAKPKPAPKPKAKEDFELEVVSDEQVKAEQAAQRAKEKKAAERKKLEDLAKKPLVGKSEDVGQGRLLKADEDLLTGPSLERILAEKRPKKKAKPSEEELAGPGGTVATDVGSKVSNLEQLRRALPDKPSKGTFKERFREAFDIGRKMEGVSGTVNRLYSGLLNAAKVLKETMLEPPSFSTWKGHMGDRHLALSRSALNAKKMADHLQRAFPRPSRRAAISSWIDAGGNHELLKRSEAIVPDARKQAYRDARKLTEEELHLARLTQQYFDARLNEAIEAGILAQGIENYIHRMYTKDSPWKQAVLTESATLSVAKPGFAKKRVYEYDAEAEAAGLLPIKDVAQRIVAYDVALNKAIADRAFVKAVMGMKMKDGRPAIDVAGRGESIIDKATGEKEATLIKPHWKPRGTEDGKNKRSDYIVYDHPSFRRYTWASEDAAGKPVFVQGDVIVHPEMIRSVKALLDPSAIRKMPAGRALLNVSSTVKQTMLDLSGFHFVQIAIHALEHKVGFIAKPKHGVKRGRLVEIDLDNLTQAKLVRGGIVVTDHSAHGLFSEGLASASLTRHIPGIGPALAEWHNFLFKEFIPRVKMTMALAALERNKVRDAKELRSGKMTEDQLYHKTAKQANAAFGGINWEMMGRSKTFQDSVRLFFLAPDFLLARTQFLGQALTRHGGEQLHALALGAATLYTTARIVNYVIDGDFHWELENAFAVVYNNRSYSLRTVQGDIMHALTAPLKFTSHRVNPALIRPLVEVLSGRDYFGRSLDFGDHVLNYIKTPIPISLRGLFEGKAQTLGESVLNAFGLNTRRYSAVGRIWKLADKWMEDQGEERGPGEFIYDPGKDPYHDLKATLWYEDDVESLKTIDTLINDEAKTASDIKAYFRRRKDATFVGTRGNEIRFKKTLSALEREVYDKAKAERSKDYRKILDLFALRRDALVRDSGRFKR